MRTKDVNEVYAYIDQMEEVEEAIVKRNIAKSKYEDQKSIVEKHKADFEKAKKDAEFKVNTYVSTLQNDKKYANIESIPKDQYGATLFGVKIPNIQPHKSYIVWAVIIFMIEGFLTLRRIADYPNYLSSLDLYNQGYLWYEPVSPFSVGKIIVSALFILLGIYLIILYRRAYKKLQNIDAEYLEAVRAGAAAQWKADYKGSPQEMTEKLHREATEKYAPKIKEAEADLKEAEAKYQKEYENAEARKKEINYNENGYNSRKMREIAEVMEEENCSFGSAEHIIRKREAELDAAYEARQSAIAEREFYEAQARSQRDMAEAYAKAQDLMVKEAQAQTRIAENRAKADRDEQRRRDSARHRYQNEVTEAQRRRNCGQDYLADQHEAAAKRALADIL